MLESAAAGAQEGELIAAPGIVDAGDAMVVPSADLADRLNKTLHQ
jgi:hypothetical protein